MYKAKGLISFYIVNKGDPHYWQGLPLKGAIICEETRLTNDTYCQGKVTQGRTVPNAHWFTI
jgi:hypothetical protein